MKPIKIAVFLVSLLALRQAGALSLADAPAEDPLAPAMARCLKDSGCKADLDRWLPEAAKEGRLSVAEARRLIANCDAGDSAKGLCSRIYLAVLDDKMKRVTDRVIASADPACRKEVGDARKAWRFRIDNACEASAGDSAGRVLRAANCRALAVQRRIGKLERLTSCTPCAPCVDP